MNPSQLEDLSEASIDLTESRPRARVVCTDAMRALEAAIVDALAGERLRGLYNLTPEHGYPPFYGVRLRGKPWEPLPRGRGVLVVDESGMLMVAHRLEWEVSVRSQVAPDSVLLSEDIEAYSKLMSETIRTHVERANRATRAYKAAEALGKALLQALTDFEAKA